MKKHLKSSMDRFIEYHILLSFYQHLNLKSSMDRFIVSYSEFEIIADYI